MMTTQTRTTLSRIAILLALVGAFYVATGCTIVKYVDDDDGSTTGPPPKVIDMLVMIDLDRGTANLTEDYGEILGLLSFGLAQQNVQIRRAAMAPLYTRGEGAVPLLFGQNDEDGEFSDFAEAIAFYTYDSGAEYLQDPANSDTANLATLGKELDTRAVYHPTTADTSGAAYFSEPVDGFLVVYLSASPRRCGAADPACEVDGQRAVNYFSAASERGVSWLELGGGASLPVDKVFHAAIVTAEGPDYATFYQQCSGQPNFPITKLDVMQSSEEHAFFGPFVDGIKSAGGRGEVVDLCEAMSTRGEPALLGLGAKIRSMF